MTYVTHPGSPKAVGTQLADRTGIATTTSTLLRHLMQPPPVTRAVRVPGVDDWSWKKRHRYGTLLVDLEQWLREHPAVEKVSRDRGNDYVRAVTRAAPQARKAVDRFHLVRNLLEVLQKILAHCSAEIRQPSAEQLLPAKGTPEPVRLLPTPATWQQRTPPHIEIAHQARQDSRDDRFRQMTAMRAHVLTQVEIAKLLGMSERAVRNWLKRGVAPNWKRQFRRRSVFYQFASRDRIRR
jgi:hypothetical protein